METCLKQLGMQKSKAVAFNIQTFEIAHSSWNTLWFQSAIKDPIPKPTELFPVDGVPLCR